MTCCALVQVCLTCILDLFEDLLHLVHWMLCGTCIWHHSLQVEGIHVGARRCKVLHSVDRGKV